MIESIMEAYCEGVDEETIMRIFDITFAELQMIVLSY